MEKLKLYALMKTLSKEDLKSAKKFLDSPFHNTDPHVTSLFTCLRRHHPGMESPALESKALFREVFPNTEYDERKLRNLRHKLTQQMEAFLAVQAFQTDPAAQRRQLLQAYKARNAYPLFKKETEAQFDRLENENNKSLDYHREMAWLYHEVYFHPNSQKYAEGESLFTAISHFERYFCLTMLCYSAELQARRKVLNETAPEPLFQAALAQAARRFATDNLATALLLKLMFADTSTEISRTFGLLKKELLDTAPQMGDFDLSVALKMLINKGLALLNNGERTISRDLLELFKLDLTKNLLGEAGEMDVQWLITIAFTGVLVGEFDWTKHFVNQYIEKVDPSKQADARHLCSAHWYYYRALPERHPDDFKKASERLNRIHHSDEFFGLLVRPLQLRILYDSYAGGGVSELLDAAKNFNRYVSRHEALSNDKRQAYLNFSNFFKKLVSLKEALFLDPIQVASLAAELAEEKKVALKFWLEEKVEEMNSLLH